MDFRSVLIQKFFYPMWQIYDGNTGVIKYLDHFRYIDSMSTDELLASQKEKLRSILIHAYENVPYYKGIFDEANFSPDKFRSNVDFHKIPFLTKAVVKENYDDLVARNVPKEMRREASTGGSTGIPMYFLRDQNCLWLRRGQELYFDGWMGYRLGNKIAYFVAGSHYDGKIDHLKAKIRNATSDRILSFDPHNITDEIMEKFYHEFVAFKPSMIKCFPNALTPFVHFINRKNLSVPQVRSISCTGENLYPQQRDLFKKVFGGEVFEKVGTRESGVFASECERHMGLHVFTEGVFLEVVKENGDAAKKGEMGKIIITDLFNKAMPLIRYEIGDMAISAGDRVCMCGSKLPMIEKYLGRDRDIIIDSFGNPKPGYLFVEVIKHLNLDAQLQVIQRNRESLVVKVAKKSTKQPDLKMLFYEYQKIVGPKIKISVEDVDEIKRDPSGKFSYVKSEIRDHP